MRFLKLIPAAAIFLASYSHAGVYSGTDLHNELQSYDRIERGQQEEGDYQLSAHASGYIEGLSDLMISQGNACPGDRFKSAQANAVISKWLNEHPALWTDAAFMLVGQALYETFPCDANKQPLRKK